MLYPSVNPLLLKRSLAVESRGELVILRIDNVELPMHYEHALDVSRWIRSEGRAAKSLSGRGRSHRSLAVPDRPDPTAIVRQPGVAIHVKPKLKAWRREDVSLNGRIVAIRIGATTITLHFEVALKVAQWLRVRAKESMRRAGDTGRHWSEVGNLEV